MSWITIRNNNLKYSSFNRCFLLTNEILDSGKVVLGVNKIADYVIQGYNKSLSEIFLQDPNNWVSKIIMFPINMTLPNFGKLPSYKLKLGKVETDIKGQEILYTQPIYVGEIYVKSNFKNFADFNGYTKIKCWLPFLGEIEIMPNDCMGKYLEFTISVDIQTGAGAYIISVSDSHIIPDATNPTITTAELRKCRVIGIYNCNFGFDLPLGSSNSAEIKRNLILGAVQTIGSVALSAAGFIPITNTISNETQTISTKSTIRSPKTNRQITSGTNTQTTQNQRESKTYYKKNYISEIFDYGVSAVGNMHMSVSSDRINNPLILEDGMSSIYVAIYRPKIEEVDNDYLKLYGKPLGKTKKINNVHGFTTISAIHLEGQNFGSITKSEMAMLEEALNDGIILP